MISGHQCVIDHPFNVHDDDEEEDDDDEEEEDGDNDSDHGGDEV